MQNIANIISLSALSPALTIIITILVTCVIAVPATYFIMKYLSKGELNRNKQKAKQTENEK